jgi:uncharacterized membrane protein YoaK (UPF0700 family)
MAGDASAAKPAPATDRALPPVLLTLTLTTGLIDAASYLGLGHVFTANMTGNIVLLGFGLANAGGLPVLAPAISLAAFLIGASAGGRLGLDIAEKHRNVFLIGIAAEVALLVAATILAALVDVRIGSASAYSIIALVAFAMGVRNAIVRKLAVPDMTTTVLTMTLTGLAADTLGRTANWQQSARRAGAVIAMLVGALVGGLLEKQSLAWPLLLAAGAGVACFAVYGLSGRSNGPRAAK